MQVVSFDEKLNCPIVLCLGYFGCMHIGHLELIRVAKHRALVTGAKVALFTFSNNHLACLGKDKTVIYTFEERLSIYRSLGIDYVISVKFDEEFRNKSGQDFVKGLTRYNLIGVVCGFDYSYGRDRMNADALRNELSVCSVEIVQPISINGEKVSTTMVRRLLSEHAVVEANALLSEKYFIEGKVEHGRHIGTQMGFPTANLVVDAEKFLSMGVYSATTLIDGKKYRAIVNIGQKPTFGIATPNVEAHLLYFDGELYGKTIKLSIDRFLRPICRFESAEGLVDQIQKDKEAVLND